MYPHRIHTYTLLWIYNPLETERRELMHENCWKTHFGNTLRNWWKTHIIQLYPDEISSNKTGIRAPIAKSSQAKK